MMDAAKIGNHWNSPSQREEFPTTCRYHGTSDPTTASPGNGPEEVGVEDSMRTRICCWATFGSPWLQNNGVLTGVSLRFAHGMPHVYKQTLYIIN